MTKASEVRNAKRDKSPFSASPVDDEAVEVILPEGAESGRIPAGDQYIGQLLGMVHGRSKSSDNPMLTWTFTMYKGDFRGMDFTLYTPLSENSMWKLADTLTALGVKWEPGVKVSIKSKELKGTLVRMKIVDDKFEDRDRSKLSGILPHPDGAGTKAKVKGFQVPDKAAEPDDEDEEDEEEERPRKSRKAAREEPEEEEEAPVRRSRKSREAEDDMDDLWAGKEKGKGKKKPVRDEEEDEDEEEERPARRRPRDEDENDEEEERPARRKRRPVDEDEDEEEEPAPRRKKRTSRV